VLAGGPLGDLANWLVFRSTSCTDKNGVLASSAVGLWHAFKRRYDRCGAHRATWQSTDRESVVAADPLGRVRRFLRRKRRRSLKSTTVKILALAALSVLGFLAAFSGAFSSSPALAVPGGGGSTGNCLGGGASKIENPGDTTTLTAPAGQVITQVAIKAGTTCYISPIGTLGSITLGGCYEVTGLGTATVTVTRTGSGPECKEISHIEYITSSAPPPPTTTTTTTTTATTP
jgi:hypothetical protein